MFVRNRTPNAATLVHGHLSEKVDVATIVVSSVFRISEGGVLVSAPQRKKAETDPPSTARYALWHGVSVTVSGTVHGPTRPPYVVPVSLQVGPLLRRLAVFGDRVWERSFAGGTCHPSHALPFESMPLSYDIAFGGSFTLPPGPHPATGKPHPGGTMAYPKNPKGRGFYQDMAMAEGQPLPNIEHADDLISEWNDRPEPAGFSPCPELVALRLTDDFLLSATNHTLGDPPPESAAELAPYAPVVAMRVPHHAPGRLIVEELSPGTPVELVGVGKRPLRFELPPPPAVVRMASGDKPESKLGPPLRPELRFVHIDAEGGFLLLEHGYMTTYRRDFAPEWVRILPLDSVKA